MVPDDFLHISCLFVLNALVSTVITIFASFVLIRGLFLLRFSFARSTLLNLGDLPCQLRFLLVKLNLFVSSAHTLLQSHLSHFLVVGQFLGQMVPQEATEVPHLPGVVVVGIVALLAADQLAVQRESSQLSVLLALKLDPALYVIGFAVATCLFTGVGHVLGLSFEVDAADGEPLSELLPEIVGVHVGGDARHVHDSLICGLCLRHHDGSLRSVRFVRLLSVTHFQINLISIAQINLLFSQIC